MQFYCRNSNSSSSSSNINRIRNDPSNNSTNTISTMLTSCSTSTNSSTDSVDQCQYHTGINNNMNTDDNTTTGNSIDMNDRSHHSSDKRHDRSLSLQEQQQQQHSPLPSHSNYYGTTFYETMNHDDNVPAIPFTYTTPTNEKRSISKIASFHSDSMDDSYTTTNSGDSHLHHRRILSDSSVTSSSIIQYESSSPQHPQEQQQQQPDSLIASSGLPSTTPIIIQPGSITTSTTNSTPRSQIRLNYSGAGRHLLHSFQQHQQRIRHRRKRRLAEYEAAILRRNHTGRHTTVRSRYVVPADHPMKLLWDFGTVIVSCIHAYKTHTSIRDRTFDIPYTNTIQIFLELWFVVDILLNFITEHRLGTVTLRTISAISARYLTTWFVIDVLSLIPGEWLFVRPVIQRLKARGRIQKWLSRTKAITRVTTKLAHRWTILRQVSSAYRRQMGIGGVARLVRTCIRYIPKYILFLRNMKAVVAVRILRQWHWMRKVYYNIHVAMEAVNNNQHPSHRTNVSTRQHNIIATTPAVASQPCLKGSISRSHPSMISTNPSGIESPHEQYYNITTEEDDRMIASSTVATPIVDTEKFSVPYPALGTNTTMDTEMEEEELRFPRNNYIEIHDEDHDIINEVDEDDGVDEFENSRVILFQESDDHSENEMDDEDVETRDDSYFYDDENDDDDTPY